MTKYKASSFLRCGHTQDQGHVLFLLVTKDPKSVPELLVGPSVLRQDLIVVQLDVLSRWVG
jgi:hypothetical protein